MSRLARFAPALLSTTLVWIAAAAPAAGQDALPQPATTYQAPAHIAFVDGTAVLERDGEVDTSPASMPLLAGDRVRTRAGRVEVLFVDGSTLHLDANTVVDFQSDEVVRLLDGRIRLNIPGPERPIAYRIDAPAGWVDVKMPGEYRVALTGREVELAVLRGAADLVNDRGLTEVLAGERALVSAGLAPSQPYVFNSAAWDAFDRWSEARRDQRLGISAQYLPPDLRPYAASLDHYGTWRYEASYGYVWYPRVAVGWRPYYYGRWKHFRPFGWTWIGHDPWAWPTHHFGRWGFSAGLWFWIPGRHWAPAWVSWAYAPGFVSWCPLGFDNRPVFGFGVVKVFGGRRFDPWHAWTVVPHRRFGTGLVNINVVNVTRLDVRTRRAFAVRNVAPQFTGRAVPRAPIRVAGAASGVAVPRGGLAVPRDGSRALLSSSPSSGARTREAFRSRGSSGASLTGPGYPAPARDPRPVAVPRSGDRANRPAGVRTRTAPDGVQREGNRAVPRAASPGERSTATPARRAGSDGASAPPRSRAVPRTEAPSASPTPARGTPSRRVAPRGGGGGSAEARRSQPPVFSAPSFERSRAVPRRRVPAAPARSFEPPSSRRAPSAASPSRSSAVPRIGRGSERSSRPGVSAPSMRRAPAPAHAPAQRSAGPAPAPSRGGSSASGSAPSRSRGGQPSTGRAVSRRGGGGD